MKSTTRAGIIGFLLGFSTFNFSETNGKILRAEDLNNKRVTIESRLSAISDAIKEREAQLREDNDLNFPFTEKSEYAWGNWRNTRRGSKWSNTRRWSNFSGPGGNFTNFRRRRRPFRDWPNRWRDRGRFVNYRYY